MKRPEGGNGERNLIAERLKELRRLHSLSQRDLARQLQLAGMDLDKNVITRIETNKRYVTDLELKALACFFGVTYGYLLDGTEPPGGMGRIDPAAPSDQNNNTAQQ